MNIEAAVHDAMERVRTGRSGWHLELTDAYAEVARLRGIIDCATNALTDSILCSGNDAQTNLQWVRQLRGEVIR